MTSELQSSGGDEGRSSTTGCRDLRMGICLKNLQGEDAQGEFTKPDLDEVLISLVAEDPCCRGVLLEGLAGRRGPLRH